MGKQRLSDGIDVHYGEYAISGVTVINSSRQLRNITALRIDATEIINGSRQLVNVAGYTQTSGNASIEHASSPTFELKDTTNNVTFKAYAQDSNAFVGTTSSHTLNIGTANTAAITVDTSQVVTFADDIVVPDQITHAGDTDTYMQFSAANVWRVVAAGSQVIKATGTTFEVDKTLHAESGIIAFGASPVITSRAADSEIVLKSQNESASNADQFHIAHQLGNVQLYNARGIMRYYMGSNSSTYIEGDGSYAEVNTAYGYTRIGAGNASYSHFYTDRPAYYFNKKLQENSIYPDIRKFGESFRIKAIGEILELKRNKKVDYSNVYNFATTALGKTLRENVVRPSLEKIFGKKIEELHHTAALIAPLDRVVAFDLQIMKDLQKSKISLSNPVGKSICTPPGLK